MFFNKLILIVLLGLLSGCAATIHIPTTDNLVPINLKLPSNQEKFFSGLFLADDGQGNRLRYAIQFVEPTKLRIELYPTTSFYQLGLLVVDGRKYRFISANDGQNEIGDFTPSVLQQNIGLEFTIEQLVSAVLQKIPSTISDYTFYSDNNGNYYVFSLDNSFIGIFNQENLTPKEFFYFSDNSLVAKLVIDTMTPNCKLQVIIPKYDAKINVECLMFKTDKVPSESRFSLD